MGPGFSERTFEFCYNAEYCHANFSLLASHPHLPSQRAEKDLGYDVEFKIKQGKFTTSLFLQHKVPHFAAGRAGRNAAFYDVHGKPYFRFAVDGEQHNVLTELSNTKGNAFYCAPRFHSRSDLERHFRSAQIAANSVLLDPLDVGPIADQERHNITYDAKGKNPTLHSSPRPFSGSRTSESGTALELKRHVINESYLEELSDELVRRTRVSKFSKSVTAAIERARPVVKVQLLLARVYQVSWLLVP